ncbi:1-aminocyclopropane-1-carboxylate deaminase/D-cysteine desulfhydrase [Longivirga aurantiaca]|uniref:1-aminocyclopropane-1-carboxylate deaminase/D-cysteine desulfhydrase n=1 Tax=Longivirga aurantiaca TaxID=1837743 RepID=A0ABW1T4Z6_9ACTN
MADLADVARVRLATLPTPLHPAPRLSDRIGVEVWFKRDDLTGLGLGGNKVRGLEYLLADALAQGCDHLVTAGGPQSNWAMLAALAARTRGLGSTLVSFGDPPREGPVGNHALALLAGARLHFTGDNDRASADRGVDDMCERLRAEGLTPYGVHRGGATGLGALGYVQATAEIDAQVREAGLQPRQLWLATGSCGTQAGLVAGRAWLALDHEVVGVTVSRPATECAERVRRIAADACALIDVPSDDLQVNIVDGFLGPAKGVRSPEGDEAAELVARTEGVFLDPVFAAKAMAGLLARARDGAVEGPVVFLVSGGAPTLFTV